jgi:hypothetical protein
MDGKLLLGPPRLRRHIAGDRGTPVVNTEVSAAIAGPASHATPGGAERQATGRRFLPLTLHRIAVLRDSLLDCDALVDDARREGKAEVLGWALELRDQVAAGLASAIAEASR